MNALTKRVKQTEINDKSFQIYLLKASEGIPIAKKLSTIVFSILETSDGEEVELDFSKVATALTDHLDEAELMSIIQKMIKGLSVDGGEVNFDDYFMANYGELIQLLTFALQENFGSFFEGMATTE